MVKAFGIFLFQGLATRHQHVVQRFTDFTALVLGIHHVIHVEVNKLYQDPNLPTIAARVRSQRQIEVRYQSPRKLCYCAEGLLFGAAQHFNRHISISHDVCMHQGADHCMLIIELADE